MRAGKWQRPSWKVVPCEWAVTNGDLLSIHPDFTPPPLHAPCHHASCPYLPIGQRLQVLSRFGLGVLGWDFDSTAGPQFLGFGEMPWWETIKGCISENPLYLCFPDEQKAFHPPACFHVRQRTQNSV